jgi:uncharacterized membrane protein YgdD (TMEM256/DUF423 family)
MFKTALNAAAIFALTGVLIGAMGAHALKTTAELHEAYETAVRFQFYHSFALAFAGILNMVFPGKWIRRATWFFIIGILLFSGSLYLLVYLKTAGISGLEPLGILTPVGGLFFILGWLALLLGINRKKAEKN